MLIPVPVVYEAAVIAAAQAQKRYDEAPTEPRKKVLDAALEAIEIMKRSYDERELLIRP